MALAYLTINLDDFTGDDHPPISQYSTITLDPGADHIDEAADVIHVRTIVVSLDQQGKAATANGVPCVDGKVPVVAGVMYAVLAPNVLRDGPHYIPALTAGQVVDLSDYITPGAPLTPDQAAILTARIKALETTPPDHGALTGLNEDDHPQYALADGTRGAFAAPLGADDNYVTDAEKAALSNLSGTNTGDQTLPTWSTISGKPAVVAEGATQAAARTAIGAGTSSFSGAYADLSGKPTLGTAAATAATAYATAAQGAKADTAVQPADLTAYATAAASTTRGVVAFTYDDAYTSWRDVSALASARGQRNTFMVTTDMLNSVGKITTADVEALYAAGHEIGAHSKTHANLTSIGTAAARVVEYDTPKTVLEGIVGVGNIKSWAYPFGAFNTTTNQELYGRYQAVYGIGYVVPCAIPLSDRDGRFLIGRQSWNQATHETVLGLIRLAATTPIAVVIYCHDPGNTSGGFPTDPTLAQVAEAYDLAAALGVPSVRCSEAIPSGNLVRNGGFEEGLTGWQTPIAKPASITFEAATDTPVLGLPGTKSMHIGATVAPGANFIVEQVIPAKPNTSYSFSSRWRMENFVAGELVFSFQRLDYAGNVVGETFSSLAANSGWAAATRTVVTEANCVSINMKYTVGATFRADAYVDHIDLRPTAFGTFG